MYAEPSDLAALVSSRICHDLISPLGAISNGLELLALNGQDNSPEFGLISDSIENANSKIRFFRLAYGAAAVGTTLARPEIASILDDNFKGTRLAVVWHPHREVLRRDAKLAFLAIQCLEAAMPWGGSIDINVDHHNWSICAQSERLKIDDDRWKILMPGSNSPTISASVVQFAVLRDFFRYRKPEPEVHIAEHSIKITF